MKVGDKVEVVVDTCNAYTRGYDFVKSIPGTIITINKRGFAKVQYEDFKAKNWAEYYESKTGIKSKYIIRRKLITRHIDKLIKGL